MRVYRVGGRGHVAEDLAVGGSQSQFPVEDAILEPLIEQRRRGRESKGESGG